MPKKKITVKKIGTKLKKARRTTANVSRKSAPILGSLGKTAIIVGGASGQPELVGAGGALIASGQVAKEAGGQKKKGGRKKK